MNTYGLLYSKKDFLSLSLIFYSTFILKLFFFLLKEEWNNLITNSLMVLRLRTHSHDKVSSPFPSIVSHHFSAEFQDFNSIGFVLELKFFLVTPPWLPAIFFRVSLLIVRITSVLKTLDFTSSETRRTSIK